MIVLARVTRLKQMGWKILSYTVEPLVRFAQAWIGAEMVKTIALVPPRC